MKGKVKISDVALQSGVSISTVFLVLNQKPGVSQNTRNQVIEIAKKLNTRSSCQPIRGEITT